LAAKLTELSAQKDHSDKTKFRLTKLL